MLRTALIAAVAAGCGAVGATAITTAGAQAPPPEVPAAVQLQINQRIAQVAIKRSNEALVRAAMLEVYATNLNDRLKVLEAAAKR